MIKHDLQKGEQWIEHVVGSFPHFSKLEVFLKKKNNKTNPRKVNDMQMSFGPYFSTLDL